MFSIFTFPVDIKKLLVAAWILFASCLNRTLCESDAVDVFVLTLAALHYGSHPSKRGSILALYVCQSRRECWRGHVRIQYCAIWTITKAYYWEIQSFLLKRKTRISALFTVLWLSDLFTLMQQRFCLVMRARSF